MTVNAHLLSEMAFSNLGNYLLQYDNGRIVDSPSTA